MPDNILEKIIKLWEEKVKLNRVSTVEYLRQIQNSLS